ncbi:hypothetical protein IPG41_05300 [Candidatus Peregrinibacteria bacterium]|nr:MAG: hypothetical protein IPG41_05300 [Candidatus Peregrinibacteria bacterium]
MTQFALKIRAVLWGGLGASLLLILFFSVVSLISGWDFAQNQFAQFWIYILPLALGFGLQVGLYAYLKMSIAHHCPTGTGKALAVSGTSSTLAMISCCAHYLANIIPILGVSGFLTVIPEYQKELFLVGLAFNVFGLVYITKQILNFKKQA